MKAGEGADSNSGPPAKLSSPGVKNPLFTKGTPKSLEFMEGTFGGADQESGAGRTQIRKTMPRHIVKERTRGFICVTSHPEGCARNVRRQAEIMRSACPSPLEGPKRVLVIGGSTGYGLATRVAATVGFGAKTLGVYMERPPEERRPASAGYYNTAAFNQIAREAGLYAGGMNGDAFSREIKRETARMIRKDLGTVDLVVYSLAAPRRDHSESGEIFQAVLKPIGDAYTGKSVNLNNGSVGEITIEPADEDEIVATVSVMGGEDWQMWINMLLEEKLLAEGARTLAYSYVGPELTWPIYRDGTIGMAKKDLKETSHQLNDLLESKLGGGAWVSVNKAVVTQASSAIPVVPLYISLLFRVMKEKDLHEGCIEQMRRLTLDHLAGSAVPQVDDNRLVRLDDVELRDDIQEEVRALWDQVNTENLNEISDYEGFRRSFSGLFGFQIEGIDYDQPVDLNVPL